jgi:polyisoprenoid-binding protein YceI
MTMKTLRMALVLAALPALALAADKAATGELKSLSPTVKILGDSTMHKWEANATALTVSAEIKAGDLLAEVKAGALSKLTLVIGVDGLQSTESKSMDKNMHKAMESDAAPQITFSMKSYALEGETVTAKGSLSIHNVAKDVELKGVLTSKDGALQVKGSYDLLMSDYGVKPPVMMLGTVKVKDAVTIAYQFDLTK